MKARGRKSRRTWVSIASGVAVIAPWSAIAQNTPPTGASNELPSVEVVGTTPLPSLGAPIREVPANVQRATDRDITNRRALDLSDFMNQQLPGVIINNVQNNPLQADVLFRGFSASPLLGTAQGLSVYQDGVRINEPFGDIVNWALIPRSAISSMTLMPGSNPVFGLNTVGGALSVHTKTGRDYPGTAFEAQAGSWGRRTYGFEHGGSKDQVDWFITGNLFKEDGWRDFSPTDTKQLFGQVGWQNARTDVDISYAFADTDLIGNGLTPGSLLARNRRAVFTHPDQTQNKMHFINARVSHEFDDQYTGAANLYSRTVTTRTFNGDFNDDYEDEFEELTEAGGACAGDPDPEACAEAALARSTGANNRTRTKTRGYGTGAQLTRADRWAGGRNRLTVGVSFDGSKTDFRQTEQEAFLDANRATVATEDEEVDVQLKGTTRAFGLYFTNTVSFNELWHLTVSGRFNRAKVVLRDQIGTELNGDHSFSKFNPAIGLNYTPTPGYTAWVSFNQGNRVPTPIELGCADPAQPCKLPNAMAADPPLKQIVSRTIEVGSRGRLVDGKINWSAALFRTDSDDDIQFISSSITGAGYFANVGKTRRQGFEAGISGATGAFAWRAGYAFVDATYRAPFTMVAEDNSAADDDGVIQVNSGNRIPGIPRHSVKLSGDWFMGDRLSVGANVIAMSGTFARGNENNAHQEGVNAEGNTFVGNGRVSGFAVVNLTGRYAFGNGLEVFALITNLFDRRYSTAAVLGRNPFDANGQFIGEADDWVRETAYSPGAPRAAWVGVRYAFNGSRLSR